MGEVHPKSTSPVLSVPAYIKKKPLNSRRKTECTCAQMMGKSPDVQIGIWFQHGMWDFCRESGVKYLRL